MGRLENISTDRLLGGLETVDGKPATLRLVVGINYKNGVTQTELAEWYGVSRTTIHNWLTRLERLESEPLDDAIYNAPRSGRPAKLAVEQREQLQSALQEPPSTFGLDARVWSPALVRRYIKEQFDVDYTHRHIRELMNDAGLMWKTARQ